MVKAILHHSLIPAFYVATISRDLYCVIQENLKISPQNEVVLVVNFMSSSIYRIVTSLVYHKFDYLS